MISRRNSVLLQTFLMAGLLAAVNSQTRSQQDTLHSSAGQDPPSVHLVEQAPVAISKIAPGVFLVDFGRVAFGNLSLGPLNLATSKAVTVRFGEALKDGRVDTHPPGSVRYSEVKVVLDRAAAVIVAPPVDARNTKAPAVLSPASLGVLTPFRWVEVEGWPTKLHADQIRRRAAFDSFCGIHENRRHIVPAKTKFCGDRNLGGQGFSHCLDDLFYALRLLE